MLQNFHYLLGEDAWRFENDWIHRAEDNQMESFDISIAKRPTINIRQRDKDDAYAIKDYYDNVYMKNRHEVCVVFNNATELLEGIRKLKHKTFANLLELHYFLSLHSDLIKEVTEFEEYCKKSLYDKSEYVRRKCSKKYYMENRTLQLIPCSLQFINDNVERSFNNEEFLKYRAVITTVWQQLVPANLRGSNDASVDTMDMVAMLSHRAIDVLGEYDIYAYIRI